MCTRHKYKESNKYRCNNERQGRAGRVKTGELERGGWGGMEDWGMEGRGM